MGPLPARTAAGVKPVSTIAVTDHVGVAEARDLLVQMVGINSSTGHELELVEFLDRWCRTNGLVSKIDRGSGSAGSLVVELPGAAALESPAMLFYAPLDTAESVELARDAPWFGSLAELQAWREVKVQGDEVAGVGAENPKGFALATLMAIAAIKRSGTQLKGTLRVALCGSAMPTLGVDPSELGLGTGLLRLLQQGLTADFALSCKPGWTVAHEEVGLVWLRVRLTGRQAYVGFRHKAPYDNPIARGGQLAAALDAWFISYAEAETSGLVAPQGVVAAIRAGAPERSAFVGEVCDLYLDVRVSPRRTPIEVARLVERHIAEELADLDPLSWSVETIACVPPSETPESSWIIRCARDAWQQLEGRDHEHIYRTSGASDTCILRTWGIPTARVGMPLRVGQDSWLGPDGLGLNVVNVRDCARLADLLVRTAVDTCNRSLAEVLCG
jgi:acetylornithine deacetylase/succinyl-diaminopimelate desuccinylase-like protein